MEMQLLATLLATDSYKSNRNRLKRSIFSDDAAEVYDILGEAHTKYQHDILPDEILALWVADNPVATNAERADFQDVISDLKNAQPYSQDIATDVIEKLWRKETGRQIADLGIRLSEGEGNAMTQLQALMERVADSYLPDDFGDTTTKDLPTLLKRSSNASRWQFNINSLSTCVYGIGPGEFMVLLARPETGKTAFLVSLMAGPGGFCDQGAKVVYLGNEEDTERTMLRAYQAAAGMDIHQVIADPKKAVSGFFCAKDNLEMKDVVDWDLDRIDAYCRKMKPDVLVIDQADKVGVSGHYNATHERFRELYRRLRELAKRHQCALIGISQASADAEGKTRVDFSMAEGSKTGKAAEADLIIGIGKHSGDNDDGEPDNTRFLTVSKNKLSGYHGTIPVLIEPEVSRYRS
jgi:replicative DNA helicase